MELTLKQKKLLASKTWRRSHLYKIKDKQGKLVIFTPNSAQRDFEASRHSRNIILKSRQLGFTTYETIDALDDTLFNKNFDALFVAHGLEPAKDIFDNKIDLAWHNFPLAHLYKTDMDTARKIKYDFGDGTFSSIAVSTSGRSGTFSRLHITEFAKLCKQFPDRAREVLEGSIPAVPNDGRVDIESTADGSDGQFHDIFWEAWDRGEPRYNTEFKAHFYNWQWDEDVKITKPIKDLPQEFLNYQKQYKLTDKEIAYYYLKFLGLGAGERNWSTMWKEYPTTPEEAFAGSGKKLFDLVILGQKPTRKPIKEYNNFRIYYEYELGHAYAIGCDVAEGIGQDSSTIVLWDFTPARPRIVAEYANNDIAPDLFAYEIKNLAEKYEQPLVAVERNNHGHATISKLRDIYPIRHIYKDEKDRLGWQTNLVSKPNMLYDLNMAVNEDLIDINSRLIISEMKRYDKEDLRILKGTEDTKHHDLLMAACIGFQMKNYAKAPRINRPRKGKSIKRGKGIRGI